MFIDMFCIFILQPISVGTLPLPMQELAIVEDLLFLMMVLIKLFFFLVPTVSQFCCNNLLALFKCLGVISFSIIIFVT